MSPDRAWRLTPGEGNAALRTASDAAVRDRRGRIAQAWYTANLSRARRLPSLRRLLEPGGHVATPEEAAESQAAFEAVMTALEEGEGADG